MRILLTNVALVYRGGSELYIVDTATWLAAQGHEVMVYSPVVGPVGEALGRTVPVTDRLAAIPWTPDVIHGHHHVPTMSALARFPTCPTVSFCHGVLPWDEAPPVHPAIAEYVAVSELTRERILTTTGVDPLRVHLLPNFVDTDRFLQRHSLPGSPRRALLFGNGRRDGAWVELLRRVCAERGLALDVGGLGASVVEDPHTALMEYDVVFARGRCALEAMATGAYVVLCDVEGLGPRVTVDALETLGAGNFGFQVIREAHAETAFVDRLDGYDPAEARRVSDAVRQTRARSVVLPRLMDVYGRALSGPRAEPADAALAQAAYVLSLARDVRAQGEDRHHATLISLNGRIAEREATISALGSLIEEHGAAASTLRFELARMESLLTAARAELGARDEEVAALTNTMARLTDEVTAVRHSLREAGEQAEVAKAQLAAARAHADAAGERAEATMQEAAGIAAAAAAAQARWAVREVELLARAAADRARADDLERAFLQLSGGFINQRLAPGLWKARQRLAPDGSLRHAALVTILRRVFRYQRDE